MQGKHETLGGMIINQLIVPPPLVSLQDLWRWSSPPSLSPHTSVTQPFYAVRSPATRHPSSAGRRTGRTCRGPLTQMPVWRCCRPALCRSAVSSRRIQPLTAVWPTTRAAPGRDRTPSCECSQVTRAHMAAWPHLFKVHMFPIHLSISGTAESKMDSLKLWEPWNRFKDSLFYSPSAAAPPLLLNTELVLQLSLCHVHSLKQRKVI